jgi:hypothetical protein
MKTGAAGIHDVHSDLFLDQNAKMALAYAAKEADSEGNIRIDTDHLLRGLLCFPNEVTEALNSVGLDLDGLRAAANRHRHDFPDSRLAFRNIIGFVWDLLKPPLLSLGLMAAVGLLVVLIVRLVNR